MEIFRISIYIYISFFWGEGGGEADIFRGVISHHQIGLFGGYFRVFLRSSTGLEYFFEVMLGIFV